MPADSQSSRQRVSSLLRAVLLVFGGQILIIFLAHFLYARGTSVFKGFCEGYDFTYFHRAAQAWRMGHNPYQVNGFVTPPPSLIIPSLVAHLSEVRATRVFLCLNMILVPLSLWWYGSTLGLRWRELVLLLVSASIFISTQECIRGGNMDGLMFALLVAAFCVRRRVMGPLWLAASMVIKVYSVIFLAVAIRRRQWRFVGLTILAVFLLLLPFHDLWPSALHALVGRNTRYLYLSVAPARLIFSISGEGSRIGNLVNLSFWAATFSFALYRDREVEFSPYTLARYVPWMLALPTLVFSYVGVLALAVLASLLAIARQRPLHRAEYCSFLGFLLLGIHTAHITNLLPLPFDTYHGAPLVQSAGVVLMILGTCFSPSHGHFVEPLHRTNVRPEQSQAVASCVL
jgi:Glycosyltransferase family 87